jgi:hypothetical protein
VLEQTDDGQHQPDDANVSTRDECLTESSDYFEKIETTGYSSRQTRHGNDEQRIDPQHEADDD